MLRRLPQKRAVNFIIPGLFPWDIFILQNGNYEANCWSNVWVDWVRFRSLWGEKIDRRFYFSKRRVPIVEFWLVLFSSIDRLWCRFYFFEICWRFNFNDSIRTSACMAKNINWRRKGIILKAFRAKNIYEKLNFNIRGSLRRET